MFRKRNLIRGFLFGLLALATLTLAVQPLRAAPITPMLGEENALNQPAMQSWHYRRPVTITNSGGALTNYQVRVSLNASFDWEHINSDGSDVRFFNSDRTTPIPFWIESWNYNSSASIWVKVPSIAASPSTTIIYFAYGNPSAISASSGPNTFILFDSGWKTTLNPVHTATQLWWEADVTYPMVFLDTNPALAHPGYQMLFDGHHNPTYGEAKGYAYSSNLTTWTEYDSGGSHPPTANAIMGPNGYPGNNNYAWGDTIKVDSIYHMYTVQGAGVTTPKVVHAQSTDLIHWTSKTGISTSFDVITTTSFLGEWTGIAILKEADGITPIVVNNKYWMVFFHQSDTSSMYLAYADTNDLLTWTTAHSGTPILTAGPSAWEANGFWTPSFVRVNNTYYLYYQGLQSGIGWQLGFASAPAFSGVTPIIPENAVWTKSPSNPVVTKTHGWDNGGCQDPILRYFNGKYYLFYTGLGTADTNGFATSTSPEGPWIDYCPNDGCGFNWDRTNNPTVSNGLISLASGQSVQTFSTSYSPGVALGFRALFRQGSYKWVGFIAGTGGAAPFVVVEQTGANLFLTNDISGSPSQGNLSNSYLGNFIIYEIAWLSSETRAYINHSSTAEASLASLVPSGPLPIQLRNHDDTANTLDVDWVYLRQFSDPEPTVSLGSLIATAVQISSFNARADDSFTNMLLAGLGLLVGIVTLTGLRLGVFRK